MPTPGTYQHLEYLQTADLTSEDTGAKDFLHRTNAAKTLGAFIKRNRIFRPIRNPYMELDTRLIAADESWIPLFNGSVYRNPSMPDASLLAIHARPEPWAIGRADYTYNLTLPVHYDFNYDASRPAQASIYYGTERGSRSIFNEAAFPEYNEDDPAVLTVAINMAARDLVSIVRYLHGYDSEPWYVSEVIPNSNDKPKKLKVAKKLAELLK